MINKLKELLKGRLNISFARAGDDIQLMKLIQENSPGVYVDIGCWHPIKASNTYYFYLRNWKGICIDPNPNLKELYVKYRPKDIFINSGIGVNKSILDYYVFNESSMNTFSKEFVADNKLESKVIDKIKMPLIPLKEILDNNLLKNDRLDFFDIDVEGFDLEVLKSNDWSKYRPKIILVESNFSIKDDLISDITIYLKNQNYRLLGKTIINMDLGNLIFISNLI